MKTFDFDIRGQAAFSANWWLIVGSACLCVLTTSASDLPWLIKLACLAAAIGVVLIAYHVIASLSDLREIAIESRENAAGARRVVQAIDGRYHSAMRESSAHPGPPDPWKGDDFNG